MKMKLVAAIMSAAMVLTTGCTARNVTIEQPPLSGETPSASTVLSFDEGSQPTFSDTVQVEQLAPRSQEVKAVWLAYVNYADKIKGKTRTQFTTYVNNLFANIKTAGFNRVFVQVRPFGDALYPSSYYPWSRFLTGTEGVDPGYDPLAIFCSLADKHGLDIEAWINPYRVSTDGHKLAANNPAAKWKKAGTTDVFSWDGGLYYNPASTKVQELTVNGVREIVENYDVDGIHFDDYFYPTTNMSVDAASYKAAKTNLTQAQWRRKNVDALVKATYAAIKEIDPNCQFGISPQANMDNNYNGQFSDVEEWIQNPGYVDYICPQIYFGFKNATLPFDKTLRAWDALITQPNIKLYVGLGAYKLGTADKWAGAAGKNEWITDKGILSRMVTSSRGASHYGGVAVYSVDSILKTNSAQINAERTALTKTLAS